MKRRDLVVAGGLGGALLASGCTTSMAQPGAGGPRPMLIDIHSHIFNASDLPIERFIKIVFLKHYPKQAVSVMAIDDPDALDQLIHLFKALVIATRSPTALDEIRVLSGESVAQAQNALQTENDKKIIIAIADYTRKKGIATGAGDSGPLGRDKILRAIQDAGMPTGLAVSGESSDEDLNTAINAYRSMSLGVVLRWFGLFTRYRHVLAEKLAADHARQNFQVALLCPALVDYDHWLGQHLDTQPGEEAQNKFQSSLDTQVSVMGRISRRKTGPVVHGYVAFDPLRQVAWDTGVYRTTYEPLVLVRKAIRDEGFIGVKLYPPMGFRALGNDDKCQTYSIEESQTLRKLLAGATPDDSTAGCTPRPVHGSAALGKKLDTAMTRLFDLCTAEKAVILSHTNDSNGSNTGFSHRADPAFWLPVLEKWPTLHVAFAHFGSFDAESQAKPAGATGADASWEWTLGRFLRDHPQAPVYADISYLVEIVGKNAQAQRTYDDTVAKWVRQFDPECRHLMFGTDWIMLGIDPAYEGYTERVYQYFKTTIGFSDAMLKRLFAGNAAAFLGLRKNDAVRDRLARFYNRNGIPESRLPLFETT